MSPSVLVCSILALACTRLASAEPPAAFAVCAACHASDGAHGLGPSINGVYGRKAGSVKGFNFSVAMKRINVVWDEETLDAFIADPQRSIPGNVMPFAGIADPLQRSEIVRYLKVLK
ncbi:MAG: c-type cytochrome [Burkholderiaceae bacterium]|nr:c-type cytochrome [Burkholderiaceae bacterium]